MNVQFFENTLCYAPEVSEEPVRRILPRQSLGPVICETVIHGKPVGHQQHDGQKQKHTTGGIPRWSPTLVLVARFSAYVWQSGRDAQFSLTYDRM